MQSIVDIGALISAGKIVKTADIDPNNDYAIVQKWRAGNRKLSGGPDAYESFAVPLSELLGGGTLGWGLAGNTLIGGEYIGTNSNDDFIIKTFGVEAGRFLASNGNFGVGTTTPGSKIHVNSGLLANFPILTVENSIGAIQEFIGNGSPEGAVTGNIGDKFTDKLTGDVYTKTTNAVATGWSRLDTVIGDDWNLNGNTVGSEKSLGTLDNFALPFIVNNNEVARFTTDGLGLTRLYINANTNLHGSNAGIQYSTTFANRAQSRFNAYGNHTGVAGITGFKSRGATVGSTQSVLAGDTLFRITAIGISGDNASLNLAALVDLKVSPGGVFPTYVATDFTIDLMNLAGVRSQKLILTSEGNLGLGVAVPTEKLVVQGNIAPGTDATYTLGTPALRWTTLYMASVIDYANQLDWTSGSVRMSLSTAGNLAIGQAVDPGNRLSVKAAAPFQNGGYFETVSGYGVLSYATGNGIGIYGQAVGANSAGIHAHNTNASGSALRATAVAGIAGEFTVTTAGGIAVFGRGANSLATNYTMQLKDGSNNPIFYVRNDGWVGAGAGTPNSAYSTFSHRATAFAPLGYFWADFFNNTGTTGITLKQSGSFASWVSVQAGSFGAGFGNVLELDCTANSEEASIGGYPYAGGGSFRVQTNHNGLFSGKAMAIGSGEHLINQGPRLWFYGASLTTSNQQDKYGHFEFKKENAIDGDFKAYLSLGVNDGALSTATIERMKISSNGQINFDFMPTSAAGLVSGDIWYDPLASNAVFYVP